MRIGSSVSADRSTHSSPRRFGALSWSRSLWLVLGGLVVSVLVAWCIAVFMDSMTGQMTRVPGYTAGPRVPSEWSPLKTTFTLDGFGCRGISFSYAEGNVQVYESGWPFRCMSWHLVRDNSSRLLASYSSGLVHIPRWLSGRGGMLLPVDPVWKGLGLNAGIYAIAGGVVISIIAGVRRRLRSRPGRCVECGYVLGSDLRVCPECGTAQ